MSYKLKFVIGLFFKSLILSLVFFGNAAMAKQFSVLLFTKTNGWHHESILDGVTAMRKLAARHHFHLDWQEDPSHFNSDNLTKFDVIVFLNTTGDLFNNQQKQAIQSFVRAGKGFVGIHSASDTEHNWPWYGQLIGHRFVIHPQIQTAKLSVYQHNFPGLEWLPKSFYFTDEWYEFTPALSSNLQYLLTIDENSYDISAKWGTLEAQGMGDLHPISWYQNFDGGRSFYTGLGHLPEVYQQQAFLDHLYGGIYWAATGKGLE